MKRIMYSASEIAKVIISLYKDSIDFITNLKLQKLLYYEQGYHLAYFGTPLFGDEIEAWMYGPVVPSVYEEYKQYNGNPIPFAPFEFSFGSAVEQSLFMEVFKVYNKYSPTGLIDLTHSESPWLETEIGVGNVISKEKMTTFFRTRLK